MNAFPNTVVNTIVNHPGESWFVGGMAPGRKGGYDLHVARYIGGKVMDAECDNRQFANSDEAHQYALQVGFLQPYFHRPNGFINLRLSPATRKYLRTKTDKEIWKLLPQILNVKDQPGRYFYDVRVKSYMNETRVRWINAIRVKGGVRPEEPLQRAFHRIRPEN